MKSFLATIRTIVLGTTVIIAGLSVTRTSLFGFSVDGRLQAGTTILVADEHGLDYEEADKVIASIEKAVEDANVMAAPVPVQSDPVKVSATKYEPSFFAKVQDEAKKHVGICGMQLRHSPLVGIRDRVIILCKGDDQAASARRLARAFVNAGYSACAQGTDVLVHEPAELAVTV